MELWFWVRARKCIVPQNPHNKRTNVFVWFSVPKQYFVRGFLRNPVIMLLNDGKLLNINLAYFFAATWVHKSMQTNVFLNRLIKK